MKKVLLLFFAAVFLVSGAATFAAAASSKEKKMESTDKVVKFLQDSKVFYIATIDGNKPRVRPFGAVLNLDGKVSICTGSAKNVYNQIKSNPNVEISAMTMEGKWIRISGDLVDTTNDDNKKKFFAAYPSVADIYSGGKRNDFAILSFKSGTATIEDFSGYKEVIELK